MSIDAVVADLKSLKLFGMAGAVAELAEQGAPAYHQSTGLLDQLIKAEVADREVRSINLFLIHIRRCRLSTLCRSRWSPYH